MVKNCSRGWASQIMNLPFLCNRSQLLISPQFPDGLTKKDPKLHLGSVKENKLSL